MRAFKRCMICRNIQFALLKKISAENIIKTGYIFLVHVLKKFRTCTKIDIKLISNRNKIKTNHLSHDFLLNVIKSHKFDIFYFFIYIHLKKNAECLDRHHQSSWLNKMKKIEKKIIFVPLKSCIQCNLNIQSNESM